MQGIVFEYDPARSKQNRQFTIRLSHRRRENRRWVRQGTDPIYRASDLQRIRPDIVDDHLFRIALESEMAFRKTEGRFFSGDAEFTLLRIALHDLEEFISGSNRNQVLCDGDGTPLVYGYERGLDLEIRADRIDDSFHLRTYLADVRTTALDYLIRARHVAGVFERRILVVHQDIPFSFFKSLPVERRLDTASFEGTKQALAQYGSRIRLRIQGEESTRVIADSDCRPRLEIALSFDAADLGFLYPRGVEVEAGDTRPIVYDFQRGIELHRNMDRDAASVAVLGDAGARHRKSDKGDWYLPAGKLDQILRDLADGGFLLQVNGKPLRLDVRHTWQTDTGKQQIRLSAGTIAGDGKAGSETLFDAFQRKRRYLSLSDGSYGYISSGLLDEVSAFAAKGNLAGEEIAFNDFDFPVVSDLLAATDSSRTDSGYRKLLEIGRETPQLESHPIPAALEGTLRPYQQHGFNWLVGLDRAGFNGILADDMGLGKTIQVLSLLLFLKTDRRSAPSLIVVPKTLIHNWEIETRRFAPTLSYVLHTGSGRSKDPAGFEEKDLVITSYGLVRQDFDLFRRIRWSYLILDEAQAIKNPDAKITKAVKRLSSNQRLSVSGTPVENTPVDLWSHFDFLMPGMLGSLQDYRRRYHRDIPEDLRELNLRTSPFVLRRLKSQVCQELPPKTEITLYCPFTEEQKATYDTALGAAQAEISGQESEKTNLSVHLLTVLLRLRQIACDPALASMENSGMPPESGKHEMVLQAGEAILSQGHKILVFSQFVGHLRRIKAGFDQRNIEGFYLDGSTTDRKEEIARFQVHKAPCVFFISLKAGGLGLNLTEANYAFLLDPWWNPAVENQAIDRCYRIGQENPVTVYRFITKDSIEEKVMALKDMKREVQDIVIRESDMEDTHLTQAQLEGLLFD